MCPSTSQYPDAPNAFLLQSLKAGCYEFLDEEPDDRAASVTDVLFADLSTVSSAVSSYDIGEPSTPRGALFEYLATQGLDVCTPVRLLGTGATCSVELVHIPHPDGGPGGSGAAGPLVAARKVLQRSKDPHLRAKEDAAFGREVEGLQAGLGCPFVVRLLGTAVRPDRQEMLLELAEGETLEQELSAALSAAREPLTQPLLPPARLAQIAASVLSALACLHRQGLAHLDIKPANVLLTAERRILLGDTGCAQRTGPDGLLHVPASGTPLFAAPEVKRRGMPYGPKADVFSVGVLLAVCAAWHRQTGRVLAFLRGEVGLPEFVPEGLRDLVGRMMAADPEQRPSAEEALSHPFLAGVALGEVAPRRWGGCVPR